MRDRLKKKVYIRMVDALAFARHDFRTERGKEEMSKEVGRSIPALYQYISRLKAVLGQRGTPIRDYRPLNIRVAIFKIKKKLSEGLISNIAKRPGGGWQAFYVSLVAPFDVAGYYVPREVESEVLELLERDVGRYGELLDVVDRVGPRYPKLSEVRGLVPEVGPGRRARWKQLWEPRRARLPAAERLRRVRTPSVVYLLAAMHEVDPWMRLEEIVELGYRMLEANRYDQLSCEYEVNPTLVRRYYYELSDKFVVGRLYLAPEAFDADYSTYVVLAPSDAAEEIYGTVLDNFAAPTLYVGSEYVMVTLVVLSNSLVEFSRFLHALGVEAYRIVWSWRSQAPWDMYDLREQRWVIKKEPVINIGELLRKYRVVKVR